MKKIIFYITLLLSFLAVGTISLFAQEQTTEEPVTYVYTDYQDLLQQIKNDVYAQIYDDVYDDVYQQIITEINENTYETLYADIERDLLESLGSFQVLNDEIQNQVYEVVDIANQTVVGVETYKLDGGSLGSAVIYKYDEINNLFFIISNNHVVEDGISYKVRLEDETTVEANLLVTNVDADIALLSFSAENLDYLKPAVLGSSSTLSKGSVIIAAGHPKGFDFFGSVTLGIIAGLNRVVEGEVITYIQHDAAINSGNSGGPIFNLAGEVIGINVLKYASKEIEGMGFSIPIDLVKDIIADYENDN